MDFTNGEILGQWLRLIASAFTSGLLIADRCRPTISGLLNCGEGDKPKLHLQDFAFGEISFAVTSIEVATELFKPL